MEWFFWVGNSVGFVLDSCKQWRIAIYSGNVSGTEAEMFMAPQKRQSTGTARRVMRYRRRIASAGARRVEVTIPAQDATLISALAATLRAGGEPAREVRESLYPLVQTERAVTGRDLLAFFRSSPLVGAELTIERDKSPGRAVDL